jgi:alcohol dehydrogenase class IV
MQQEFFGNGSIDKLKNILREYNPKNVFLVTGKKSFNLSGAEEKIRSILNNIEFTHFNSFSNNPNIDDVKNGLSSFKKSSPDLVLAVGGGSVLDIAKAINILSFQNDSSETYIQGKKSLERQGLPLIAIPLTSGTGSEATRFSTIYIDKKKYSLSDKKFILPTVAIIDPLLTDSMPSYLTAVTGLDALCQSIESIWSVNSNEESLKYATESVKLAFNSLEKVVKNPDRQSRVNMAKAANLSGKAINISKTTACHSISYPITSYFNIPHGHAVALTLPELIEFNYNIKKEDCNDRRGVGFVKKRMNEIIKLVNSSNEIEAKNNIMELMKKVGVESSLRKLNIDEKGLELIINKGFTPDRMNNNPRRIEKKDLEKILREIL